jgi:hypothetical protein
MSQQSTSKTAKKIIKRLVYTFPEILITVATVSCIVILIIHKPTDSDDVKLKHINLIKQISIAVIAGSVAYTLLKTILSSTRFVSSVHSGDLLLVAQALVFSVPLLMSTSESSDLNEKINTLKTGVGICAIVQSVLRLRFMSCTEV